MLRPMPIGPLPPETARSAHAAFPKGTRDLRVAEDLETRLTDEALLTRCPMPGQPALPPGGWRS
jgi:transposase